MHRAIAFILCVAAALARAADPATVTLRNTVYSYVLTLPAPTGWWGEQPRVPKVRDLINHGFLDFGAIVPRRGRSAPVPYYTFVDHLQGVRTVEDAKAHFRLSQGIDLDEAMREEGVAHRELEERTYPYGRVLIVDLGKLGWAPGNRYYYFFLNAAPRTQTVFMGPTDYMDYDLERVRFERSK